MHTWNCDKSNCISIRLLSIGRHRSAITAHAHSMDVLGERLIGKLNSAYYLHIYFWPRLGHHRIHCGGCRFLALQSQIFHLHFAWNYVNRTAKEREWERKMETSRRLNFIMPCDTIQIHIESYANAYVVA